MIRYAYDLYPSSDPKNGALVRRLQNLQAASYRKSAGTGAGQIVLRGTSPDAFFIDAEGMQYVRVSRVDTSVVDGGTESGFDELVVGGFFLEEGDFKLLDTNSTKRLTFHGAGALSYLARAQMWSHTYKNNTSAMDPFDDKWRLWAQGIWAGGNHLGSMLHRAVSEAMLYRSGATYTHRHGDGSAAVTDSHSDDRTANALPALTLGFSATHDSSGNAWSKTSSDFEAQVGEPIISVVERLIDIGLYVELDPDTFELNAWESTVHRALNDKTGAAWGAGVVLFQAPTDPLDNTTGNVKADMDRTIIARVRRSRVLAGSDDVYAIANDAGAPVLWEGFARTETGDEDLAEEVATQEVRKRSDKSNRVKLPLWLEQLPLVGKYRPFEGVDVDWLVTVDTGSGPLELNAVDFPVAAVGIELEPKSARWKAWVELGSTFVDTHGNREFEGSVVGAHSHPPKPELCRPMAVGSPPTISAATGAREVDGVGGHSISAGATPPDESRLIVLVVDRGGPTAMTAWYDYNNNPGTPPNDEMTLVDSGSVLVGAVTQYWKVFEFRGPSDIVGGGSGAIGYGPLQNDVTISGAFYLPAVSGDLTVSFHSSTGSSFTNPISADPDQVVLELAGYMQDGLIATPSATGGQTVHASGSSSGAGAGQDTGWAVGSKAGGGMSWGLSGSRTWVGIAVAAQGTTATLDGDGHPDLIGTGKRAKRCSDTEHFHSTSAPTVTDDGAHGFRPNTWWFDETTNRVYILEDNTDGAAVWTEPQPKLHASTHVSGATDPIKLDDLAAPDDNTDLNASASKHGLLPKLSGDADDALRGDGTWGAVASGGGSDAVPLGLWVMSKTASQTLTNGATDDITFDRTDVDGGSAVIDLANDRFVLPATGKYLAIAYWPWEATVPSSGIVSVKQNGTQIGPYGRQQVVTGSTAGHGTQNAIVPFSGTAGDVIKMAVTPGAITGVTARGNALPTLSTTFTLIQLAVDSGVPAGAELRRTSHQSIPNNAWTDVEWQAEEYDDAAYWAVADDERIVFAEAGRYLVIPNIIFTAGTVDTVRGVRIVRNADDADELAQYVGGAAGAVADRIHTMAIVNATAGEYVRVQAIHSNGSALNLEGYGSVGDHIETSRVFVTRLVDKATPAAYRPRIVSLVVGASATAYFADADIPRVGVGMVYDQDGNSGAALIQWYRSGTFNSLQGIGTSNHGYQFRSTTLSGGTTGFSFFIEGNAAGDRLGIKNNNASFGRTFRLWVYDDPTSMIPS